MPVHKVKGKKDCYQWGNSGKVYCGKDAKQKAIKQGYAIEKSGYREKKK